LAKNIKYNPKPLYAYVRSKTKIKDTTGPLKDNDRKLVTDVDLMSELLIDYFGTVFSLENQVNELL